MTDYYVDATLGNDAWLGTLAQPWKTFARIWTGPIVAGDLILLKRGEQWRELLLVPASGNSGQYITFRAYGTGADPIINGSDLITSWSDEGGDVWSKILVGYSPNLVYFDENRGTPESAQIDVDAEYDWYWDSGTETLYIYSAADPDTTYTDPGVEVGARNCVFMRRSWILIQNLQLRMGNVGGVRPLGTHSNIVIQDCTFFGCRRGVYGYGSDGLEITDVTVRRCDFQYMEQHGVMLERQTYNWLVEQNTCQYCGLEPGAGGAGGGGIKAFGTLSGGHTIQSNICRDGGNAATRGWGIHIDTVGLGCTVRYNRVESNGLVSGGGGINIEKSSDCEIYFNEVIGNEFGLNLNAGAEGGHRNAFDNNTCYSNTRGIRVAGDGATPGSITDNIFRNNISVDSVIYELDVFQGGENDGAIGTGNVYEYNCLGLETTNFIRWGVGVTPDTYDAWEALYGNTRSIEADPLFMASGTGDFTLQEGSPCRDAGAFLGLPRDFAGISVPQGSAPDVGANEYPMPVAVAFALAQAENVPAATRTRYPVISGGENARTVAFGALPPWEALGAQVLTPTASTPCNLPAGTTIALVRARGDDAYYELNGSSASPSSGGYVMRGDGEVVGPLSNLARLHVYSATGTVHLQYFRGVSP